MTVGTLVVTAILVVIVAAIIISMVRSHRAGKTCWLRRMWCLWAQSW